jgi:hypothetical protein
MALLRVPKLIVQVKRSWQQPWADLPQLDVLRFSASLQPTMPSAAFVWRYGAIDDGGGEFWPYLPLLDGLIDQFVRICRLPTAGTEGSSPIPVWYGIFAEEDDLAGAVNPYQIATGDQVLTARGLELLLARCAIEGAVAKISGAAARIDTPLVFNGRPQSASRPFGNRSSARYANAETGVTSYVFSDDGEPWTAADILEYVLAWFGPAGLGFRPAGELANLAQFTPSAAPARTVLAAINAVIDRRRGAAWRVTLTPNDEAPQVRVYSTFDQDVTVGETNLTGASVRIDLDGDADAVEEVRIGRSSAHRYDRIIALGGPIVVCGTVSFQAGTLWEAWGAELQEEYQAADEIARTADKYVHVFCAYTVAGSDAIAGPTCEGDGSLDLEPPPQFWSAKRLLRRLPLALGGEDEDAPDEYRPPLVVCQITVEGQTNWVAVDRIDELARSLGGSGPSMSVRLLDGEMGLLVHARPNYLLAKNDWTPSEDDIAEPIVDYQTIRATVAWCSDRRLEVIAEVPGASPAGFPRTLTIDVPDAECWVILQGTVLDVQEGALVTQGSFDELRNDSARLEAVAAMAASWYQRQRRRLGLRWANLVFEAAPGDMVGLITAGGSPVAVNSTVSGVVWDASGGTTTLSADFEELDFAGMAGRRGGLLVEGENLAGSAWGADFPAAGGGRGGQDRLVNLPVRFGAGGGGRLAPEVFLGRPTSAFSSGATITLDPCDIHGTDDGQANRAVYVKADQSSYSMTNSTSIATSAIVPHVLADDGCYYMLGEPVEMVTAMQVDDVNRKIQKKTRNVWVPTAGGESGWVDWYTNGQECPE